MGNLPAAVADLRLRNRCAGRQFAVRPYETCLGSFSAWPWSFRCRSGHRERRARLPSGRRRGARRPARPRAGRAFHGPDLEHAAAAGDAGDAAGTDAEARIEQAGRDIRYGACSLSRFESDRLFDLAAERSACASRSATRLDSEDWVTRSDGAVMATAPCEAALQTSWSCPSVVAWCFVRSRLRRTAPRSRPRPAPASPTAACLPRDPGAPSSARRPCCHLAPRSHRRCRHARGAGRPAYPARHTAR